MQFYLSDGPVAKDVNCNDIHSFVISATHDSLLQMSEYINNELSVDFVSYN